MRKRGTAQIRIKKAEKPIAGHQFAKCRGKMEIDIRLEGGYTRTHGAVRVTAKCFEAILPEKSGGHENERSGQAAFYCLSDSVFRR